MYSWEVFCTGTNESLRETHWARREPIGFEISNPRAN